MQQEVTFCSVSFHSKEYLKLNQEITGVKNWLVIPDDEDYNIPGFQVLLNDIKPYQDRYISNSLVSNASYRHAYKLNILANHVWKNTNNRYVCFIDPDFFIFQPINQILQLMKDWKLAYYGAPYWPDPRRKKIYNFPVAFCMFIDTQEVNLSKLDFTPQGELTDGTMADTGYLVYKEGLNKRFFAAKPVIHKKDPRLDEYRLGNGEIFGYHLHAKLHLRDETQRKLRSFEHIGEIKRLHKQYFRTKHDTTI